MIRQAGGGDAPLKIDLLRKQTLLETEHQLGQISKSGTHSIEIRLATDVGPYLFKDTLIASLFGLLKRREKKLLVKDWSTSSADSHLNDRFGATIEGLAAVEFADEIVDSRGNDILSRLLPLRGKAIEKNGILTPESAGGKSLTFCAFDPELPTPIGFVGLQGKESFVRRLLGIRKNFFEVGVGEGFSQAASRSADSAVAGLIYELWQNGIQHGRFNDKHERIAGMRYLRVKKHVGGSFERSRFLARAAGFHELQHYLELITEKSRQYKLYEVAVADSGIGIVDRFLATRPEFSRFVRDPRDYPALINKIIRESLSSKLNQAGAGHGLEQALRSVATLKGFLSIRSGQSWLYYDSLNQAAIADSPQLQPVKFAGQLASIGTQINLIYPLMGIGR